jgi:predicted RNA-binding protein YlqC (UPF0109 family)
MLKNLVETIAKALCDYPDEVDVKEITNAHLSLLELKVSRFDVPRIIGKNGTTFISIKNLVSKAGAKIDCRAMVYLIEEKSFKVT